MSKKKHPMQQIVMDEHGTARFQRNAIVRYLLDAGPFGMNDLGVLPFDRDDREQFAQLIGYSVGGFCDLSYASEEARSKSWRRAEKITTWRAKGDKKTT